MKYVSTYKQYESKQSDEVIENINDISIELEDQGFIVSSNLSSTNDIQVVIQKKSKFWNERNNRMDGFKIEDVQEYLIRIRDYTNSLGYRSLILVPTKYIGTLSEFPKSSKMAIISEDEYPTYIENDYNMVRWRIDYTLRYVVMSIKSIPLGMNLIGYNELYNPNT